MGQCVEGQCVEGWWDRDGGTVCRGMVGLSVEGCVEGYLCLRFIQTRTAVCVLSCVCLLVCALFEGGGGGVTCSIVLWLTLPCRLRIGSVDGPYHRGDAKLKQCPHLCIGQEDDNCGG